MSTYGYELEFKGPNMYELFLKYQIPYYPKIHHVKYDKFHLKDEPYVTENSCGGELISPIYEDKKLLLKECKEKLEMLKKERAYIPENSDGVGFHIHVGKEFLDTKQKYAILFQMLYAFQSEIYELAKGHQEYLRDNINECASPLNLEGINIFLNDITNAGYYRGKSECIRFTLNTLEFRYFNSSLEYQVIREYFQFVFSLLDDIKNETYDKECIEYYFSHKNSLDKIQKKERKKIFQQLLLKKEMN